MKKNMLSSLRLTFVLLLLLAVAYPAMILAVAQFSPGKGEGVKVEFEGKVVGYANVGQSFTSDSYFWSRPSAAGYNAAASCGSNKAPSNPEYRATVAARIDSFLVHHPDVKLDDIPADMVTASGSGLDPHISVAAAQLQVQRIASKRGLPTSQLKLLITQVTEGPWLGLLGPSKVNVLALNLALDHLQPR
ncbi:MAG: potassium-transporting ATPase subunit KdpC [Bacteroidia bacterium]|nr:potassium-transporting ATPase subunit KdpC [Bacteroidia bacterium]